MTKVQSSMLSCVATLVAVISWVVLRVYSAPANQQFIQKFFLILILVAGLVLLISSLFNFKRTNKKIFSVLFLILGIASIMYSGFVLYLILALQNAGF